VRLSLNLLSVIAVALVLQVGLCPALCFARGAGSASAHGEDARAPEKAPCHATRNAPSHATSNAPSHVASNAPSHVMNNIPSRGETPDGCGMDCSRFGSTALASLATRVGPDALSAALPISFFGLLPRAHVATLNPCGLASEPPPRDLLLVKNSFLI